MLNVNLFLLLILGEVDFKIFWLNPILFSNLNFFENFNAQLIFRGNGGFSLISPEPFKLQTPTNKQKSSDDPPEQKW